VAGPPPNPFRYGALALDDAFTNREREIKEISADVLNGQDVVVFAPRRYGKTSLIWKTGQRLVRRGALVARVDLMTTPTKARLAEKLARTIHEDIASPLFRARERLRVFSGLRVQPTISVDPDDASVGFSFSASTSSDDLDATIERLLTLPAQLAAERDRRVCLVLDEFQEVVDIDPALPRLMRAVFQEQPEVSHVYLGSRRHMMERIFNDEHEPFWRSAKQIELGVIEPARFAKHIARRFADTERSVDPQALDALLGQTGGHPYATQELCYFLWQVTPLGETATPERLDRALGDLLRSEHAHFSLVWERASAAQRLVLEALAEEPGAPLAGPYRHRHGLPAASTVQRALEYLERQELVARDGSRARIAEPFLAEWVRRSR
jgi:hypothetical protein